MTRADDDAAEALARSAPLPARLELPRTLAGGQVLTIRAALKAADVALSRIKVKGLTRAFAAEVHDGRSRIADALAILSLSSAADPARSAAVGGQTNDGTPSAGGREVPPAG